MFRASILNWFQLKSNETSINFPNNLTRFSGMLFLKKMSAFSWGDNSPISKCFSMLIQIQKMPRINDEWFPIPPRYPIAPVTLYSLVMLLKIRLEVVRRSSNPKGFVKIASRLGSCVLFSSQAVRLPWTFQTTSPDWGVVSEENLYFVPKNASGRISMSGWYKKKIMLNH